MSTTFDVYPGTHAIPTFQELLAESTSALCDRLAEEDIPFSRTLSFKVMTNERHRDLKFDANAPLRWPDDAYAFFMIEGVPGGTDAHFCTTDDDRHDDWREELKDNSRAAASAEQMRKCLEVGHYWYFRRSAGQTATLNLAYGIIAATLARMTDGLIWSFDSAWDFERFPANAQDFLWFYFRPEKAIESGFAEWSERCWEYIRKELRG